MCACIRIGAVVLPCTEQLRAKDLRLRIDVARPSLIVADERNRAELEAARPDCEVVLVPDESLFTAAEPAPAVELAENDPCLITFTSGTAGEPKAVLHAQRYLAGQRVQASHWLGARSGRAGVVHGAPAAGASRREMCSSRRGCRERARCCTTRGSTRRSVWSCCERERVNVLCMAPTEYRVIAARATLRAMPSLRTMVAAGEALNPEVQRTWREVTGLDIRDGYGQTETGQLTGMAHGEEARPGSMGRRAARGGADGGRRRADRRPANGADVLPGLPRRGCAAR